MSTIGNHDHTCGEKESVDHEFPCAQPPLKYDIDGEYTQVAPTSSTEPEEHEVLTRCKREYNLKPH